jgi:hypothetical protein
MTTPFKKHLLRIINQFKKFIGLSNICGTIDGTHIPLVEMSSKKYTFTMLDYYNGKTNS